MVGLGERASLFFCTWYDQFVFTNKRLPTIPTIKLSTFVTTKEKPIQLFSFLKVIFPYTNSYCISHINSFFDQIYKNKDIYSILYINKHGKSLFVIISIVSWSNYVNNLGSTYLQQLFLVRWIICNRISFIFNRLVVVKYVIFSYNLLLYHCFQSFPFLNWSQFITGFNIFIHWIETLTAIFQHTSSYPYITNYYIRYINFHSAQSYKNRTSICQPKQNTKSRTISFPQSNIQK